jgi:drug/metabolite transporter (DMT)-like permease
VYNPPWKLIGEMHQVAHNRGPVVWLVLLGFTTVTQIISAKSQVAAYYYVEPTYVSAVLALDPVTATILGFFIFHQILTLPQIAGVLIVLGAVVYLHLKESKEEPALESVLESERVKSTRIVMPKIHSTAMSKR